MKQESISTAVHIRYIMVTGALLPNPPSVFVLFFSYFLSRKWDKTNSFAGKFSLRPFPKYFPQARHIWGESV